MRSHFKHDIAASANRVKSSLDQLISGTEELLRATASSTGTEVEGARERLRHQLDSARRYAREGERAARERYQRVSTATDEYVHENAWKTVAGALVVGLLAGICLMSGNRKD